MLQAMFNGVSGVQAHKTELDIIGNNVANVNTIAFKASRTVFKDVISQTLRSATQPSQSGLGGTNPFQVGLGAYVGAADLILSQGSMQPTGKVTDVAIEGNGFLMASDGNQSYYTRDGSFYLDSAGNLVSTGSGFHVLGWTADTGTGTIDTSKSIDKNSTIKVLVGQTAIAKATANLELGGNLDASTPAGTDARPLSLDVYDSRGVSHQLTLSFTKSTANGTWFWNSTSPDQATATSAVVAPSAAFTAPASTATFTLNHVTISIDSSETSTSLVNKINGSGAGVIASADGSGRITLTSVAKGTGTAPTMSVTGGGAGYTLGSIFGASYTNTSGSGSPMGFGTIVFDAYGKPTTTSVDINIPLFHSDGAINPMPITIDFTAMSQLAGDDTVQAARQDGLKLGTLESFSIGKDGIITGRFSNGISQSLAQLAMADFRNSAGLAKAGNNMWLETSNSGLAQVGTPSNGSRGRIAAGFLESSNVDLPTEFTNMIVAQRGFQANARVITTSDEVLQELVQLKR